MARRLPSTPPNLPGFTFIRVLGSGGFADVFLYEQNMPRRQVAIKVMLAEVVNDQVRQMFRSEANLMAQLSAHPSIMTVYGASVSADGRPYLIMELCSPILGQRYRRERIPVADVLQIAIRIASALETAHRRGVLHRDIKPSNILTTAYGHPVLSDFGIASTLSESDSSAVIGMSVPWSAPEMLKDESNGSIATEVWSMAATIYSLLAGRSPFEVPGGENGPSELMSRIIKSKLPPIGRSDVPRSLEHLLSVALSKRPDARPRSMLELIRELQAVESEIGVAQTPIEVAMDDWALATIADQDEQTRVRSTLGVGAPNPRRRRRPAVVHPAPVPAMSGSGKPGRANAQGQGTGSLDASALRSRRRRAVIWVLVTASALVVGIGTGATIVLVNTGTDAIPVVTDIRSEVRGNAVQFSWQDPGITNQDAYQVRTSDGQSSTQESTQFRVIAQSGDRVCITVTVNRAGRSGDPSNEKCAEI